MKIRVIEYHNVPDYMLFGQMLSLTLMPKVAKIKLLHQKATPYSNEYGTINVDAVMWIRLKEGD